MMKYLITPLAFLALFGFPSCTKDTNISEMQRLWDCNTSQHFDPAKLAAKLAGSWKWTSCSSGTDSRPANKNVIVTFTSGKFSVTENSTVITRGNWHLKKIDQEILGLDMDTASTYLYGRILLCEDQLLFNDSYIDGGDYYFTRIK